MLMAHALLWGNGNSERKERMNTGDTAFVLVSPALVMLTIFWMALFYGEMVRRQIVLGTIGCGF